jgi:D(-)-tartrate dehydratase
MRIKEIREKTVSIASEIKNAYIDFSKMTCSVVVSIQFVTDRFNLILIF